MSGKDTMNTTFYKLLEPLNNKRIRKKIGESEVDKYTKKLFFWKFNSLFVYSMLEQTSSLRETSIALNNDYLSQDIDLKSISPSQLSRRLRTIPHELLQFIYADVLGQLIGNKDKNKGLKLSIVDSSVISCAVGKFPWARFRKTKSGVKIHLKIQFQDGEAFPVGNTVTTQKDADRTQMDQLIEIDPDAIYVFDRGYIDFEKFDQYCSNGLLFVTRIKKNTAVTVEEEYSAQGKITRHQKVTLGGGPKKMKHQMRLIETLDSEGNVISIVTNDFERDAEEIAEIYRRRWQIEIFFKWIKQHLEIKHLYGNSPQAVENQILIALITYCLLLLARHKFKPKERLLKVKRFVIACLFEDFKSFVRKLNKPPTKTTKGRRKIDYEREYREIERQVMSGEADHLLMV